MATSNNEKMQELTIEEKLQHLYELQKIDSEIDKIKTLRGELPLEVQDLEDEIAGLETRIENHKGEILELEKGISVRKQEIKKSEESIKKYSEQLDNVRNNREYDALTKEIEFQNQEPTTQTNYVEVQEPQTTQIQKNISQPQQHKRSTTKQINTESPQIDKSQVELLENILAQVEKEEKAQQQQTKPQTSTVKNNNFKNPYMTEQEEIIAWNKWRSNLQNQIMRDSKIDYAPLGTLFMFTFVVDKFGNISNIKVECSNPNYMDVARNNVKPAIANLQKKPILNFPRGTQRTSTVVTGLFLIGTQERYSTPNDFSDYERVTY